MVEEQKQKIEAIKNRLLLSFPDIRWGGEEKHGAYIIALCGNVGSVDHINLRRHDTITGGQDCPQGPHPYWDDDMQGQRDAQFLGNAQRDIRFLLGMIGDYEEVIARLTAGPVRIWSVRSGYPEPDGAIPF